MNLITYTVGKWNKDAERVDKFKVACHTIFDAGLTAILSTQGVVYFLNIKNSLLASALVMIFFVEYFHLFRLWHIGRALMGMDPEDAKKNAKS